MTETTPSGPGRDAIEVRHVPEDKRYELWAAGERAGFAAYGLEESPEGGGERIVFTHTEIDDRFEGQGLGSELVRGALDDVRAGGRQRVVAQCPFVTQWIEHHQEYADLLAG